MICMSQPTTKSRGSAWGYSHGIVLRNAIYLEQSRSWIALHGSTRWQGINCNNYCHHAGLVVMGSCSRFYTMYIWNAYGHNSNNDMINFVLREWCGCGKELNIYQSTVLHAQCHASFTFFQSWLAGEFKCKDLQYHLQVGHDLQRWAVHTEWFRLLMLIS